VSSRSRRVVLAAVVALLVAGAGCSAFGGGSTTNVLLVNNDDAEHAVTVEIVQDGEAQYSTEKHLPGETQADLSTFEGTGEYTVAVTVDGNTTERTYEFSGDDETVSIGVQNDGSVIVGG